MLKLECINYLGECQRRTAKDPTKGLIIASFELEECDTVGKYTEFLPHLIQFVEEYNDVKNLEKKEKENA